MTSLKMLGSAFIAGYSLFLYHYYRFLKHHVI